MRNLGAMKPKFSWNRSSQRISRLFLYKKGQLGILKTVALINKLLFHCN